MSVERVIVDGNVAVLVSENFGAGWSTWNLEYQETLLFHPKLVQACERGLNEGEVKLLLENMGYDDVYCGGWDDVSIEYVPQGQRFGLHEYDGSESLFIEDPRRFTA